MLTTVSGVIFSVHGLIRYPDEMARAALAQRTLPLNEAQTGNHWRETRWVRRLGLAAVCAVGIFVNFQLAFHAGKGGMDFNQFYAASRLAGTGHLYDWDALRQLEDPHGPAIHSGRVPVVSYAVKLVSWMPYPTARVIWLWLSIAALVLAGLLWPGANPQGMMVALAWSTPAVYLLGLGQDVAFWLFFYTMGLVLLDRGKPRAAGAVFALCICKYHLATGLFVLLISQRRWKTIAAGGLTVAGLLAASFVIEGTGWPAGYLRTVTSSDFSPGVSKMPNLHGLASWLPAGLFAEIVASIAVLALLWVACRRTANLSITGAAAAGCGLLVGHHAYIDDCVLLIPLAVGMIQLHGTPGWLKGAAWLLLTPALMFLLISAKPFLGQILIVGFIVAAMIQADPRPHGTRLKLPAPEG